MWITGQEDDKGDEEEAFEKTNFFNTNTHKIEMPDDAAISPCLVLLAGSPDLLGRQWILNKPEITLGRNPNCDIHVADPSLSKVHARLSMTDTQISVTDLDSTNKTFIEGVALVPQMPTALKNNNQIRAGSLIFKYLARGILSETSEKERMQAELQKARVLQATLFPLEAAVTYRTVKIEAVTRPATEIGGDWWWHWSSGNKAFVFIGDATGHGASAGLITSAARSAIATIEDDESVTIEKVYAILTNAIEKCSGGSMAMSGFLVEIDFTRQMLRFINASHLAAIVLPKSGEVVDWKTLAHLDQPTSSALGSKSPTVNVGETPIKPGSRLVLMTDGLTERLISTGEMMSERVLNTMFIHTHLSNPQSLTGFLKSLMQQSDAIAFSQTLDDDITVVAMDFK
jgi:serine phosphatase RsbU (regulator of sigma subunit)